MGFLDDAKAKAEALKDQAEDLARSHGDNIKQGLDKAEDLIADKLPEDKRHHAGAAVDKAKEMVDRVDDQEDDPVGEGA